MSWNYRAIETKSGVAIYAVYYDQDGKIIFTDLEPYVAHEESAGALIKRLTLILEEAKSHPPIALPWIEYSPG